MMVYVLIFLSSLLYSQCDDYNEFQCVSDGGCEWIEDIEYGNCSQLGEDACNANSNCTFDCEMYHGSCAGCCWGDCLGGNYEIDNSYCQDFSVELPDCSDLSESLCNDDNYGQGCEWFEDTYYINCNNLSDNQCNNYEECSLQQGECLQWGSWYTWICYQYDYYCVGGEVEIDNGYCEEIIYESGDINGDYSIDILDVIESINFILVGDYNLLADINHDNNLNILDVILLIEMILDN